MSNDNETPFRHFTVVAFVLWICWALFCLTGCLGTTHHFRKGELLRSGESEINWGYSWVSFPDCKSSTYRDSEGRARCERQEWGTQEFPIISRSFRVGLRDSWGPFTGVEAGYQIEIPSTIDFDLRLGLPVIPLSSKYALKHAVGAGWGIGGPTDNTWFIDYALSSALHSNLTLYTNFRVSYLATQFGDTYLSDSPEDDGSLFKSHQRFYYQTGVGIEVRLPEIFMIPDQLHLQYMISTPVLAMPGQPNTHGEAGSFQTQINWGVGWHY